MARLVHVVFHRIFLLYMASIFFDLSSSMAGAKLPGQDQARRLVGALQEGGKPQGALSMGSVTRSCLARSKQASDREKTSSGDRPESRWFAERSCVRQAALVTDVDS